MVVYWDASALVSLMARAARAGWYRTTARQFGVATWWGTYVECAASIARLARAGSAAAQIAESYRLLGRLSEEWREISASEQLRRAALRAARNQALRAGDALQLGAALVACGFEPHTARFLSEDVRLKQAAEGEGFLVD